MKKKLIIISFGFIAMLFIFLCLNLLWRKTLNNKRPTMQYGSVWYCQEADWTFEVPNTHSKTFGIINKENEEIRVEINFLYSEVYVWYNSSKDEAECCFCGDCIYYDDKFIIYDITTDEIFDFRYDKITFIRSEK